MKNSKLSFDSFKPRASIVGVGATLISMQRGKGPLKPGGLSSCLKKCYEFPCFPGSLFFLFTCYFTNPKKICYIEGSFCGETREFVCINHVCPSRMSPGTWCRPRWYQPTKLVHSVSSVAWTPHLMAVVKVGLNKLTKGGAHLLWVSIVLSGQIGSTPYRGP